MPTDGTSMCTQAIVKYGCHYKFYTCNRQKNQLYTGQVFQSLMATKTCKKKKKEEEQNDKQKRTAPKRLTTGEAMRMTWEGQNVYRHTGFRFLCLSLSFASLSRLASRLLNSSGIFS